MNYTMNPLDQLALVYGQSVVHPSLVAEPSSDYALPEADAYAKRMAEQAEAWLAHARDRSRMKDSTLVSKALHSLAFSLRHRAHDFAIPSKLSGTSKRQPALWQLTRNRIGFGTPLDVEEEKGDGKRVRLVVSFDGDALGEVQSKHVGWLRPLLPFGAGLFLTRVTGHEESYTLGCNVLFGRVGHAVEALNHALRNDIGTDVEPAIRAGIGGDGIPEGGISGDGAAGHLQLVSSAPSVAKPQGDTKPEADDVVLYREIDGTARASVEHVVRHSPSGIEWGYHGSGPADLARSILMAFSDEATAESLYQRFKAEVVAHVPKAGGVVRAEDVRAWLASKGAR